MSEADFARTMRERSEAQARAASATPAPGPTPAVAPEPREEAQAPTLVPAPQPAPTAPEPREAQRPPLVLDDIRDLETREQVRRFIERGTEGTDSTPEQAARLVCCALVAAGWTDAKINALITDAALPISRHFRAGDGNPERKAKLFIGEARRCPIKVELSENDWVENGRRFRAAVMPNLLRSQEAFYDWHHTGGVYREISNDTLCSRVGKFLDAATLRKKDGDSFKLVPYQPNNQDVAEHVGAIKRLTHMDRVDCEPPLWLDGRAEPNAAECLAFPNCVLHLPTGKTCDTSPSFFTVNACDFNFDPNAPEPALWLETLSQYFPANEGGAAPTALLQEIMGWAISADRRMHKIPFVHGPGRSGKGTINTTVQKLVGKGNFASPTLSSLGDKFGLEPILHKKIAIISDMKIGRKADPDEIVQNLKRISGGDSVSVGRKFKGAWEGRLGCGFIIFSNDLPTLQDASGAFAERCVILNMTKDFNAHPNLSLEFQLEPELPGILNWAIEGYRRLRLQGHFSETEEGRDSKSTLALAGSPIKSFVADRCILNPTMSADKVAAYTAWKVWCEREGRLAGSKDRFTTMLTGAFPGRVRAKRAGSVGAREQVYEGLGLKNSTVSDLLGTDARQDGTGGQPPEPREADDEPAIPF